MSVQSYTTTVPAGIGRLLRYAMERFNVAAFKNGREPMKILYNFTIINSLTSDIKINIDSSKYTGGEFSQAYKNATNSEKFDSEVLGAIQDILVLYQGNNQIRERGFLLATAHQEFKPYKLNLMASCEPLIPENNMIIGELLSVS